MSKFFQLLLVAFIRAFCNVYFDAGGKWFLSEEKAKREAKKRGKETITRVEYINGDWHPTGYPSVR